MTMIIKFLPRHSGWTGAGAIPEIGRSNLLRRQQRRTREGIASGFFQGGNVDLVHFHQRVHDARCFRFIGIGQHIAENDRVDLPGESEFVFEPAAPPGRSAIGGKFFPEIIDFLLGLAIDCKRDRFGKLELPRTLSGLSATNSTLSSVNSTVMTDPGGRPIFSASFG